MMRKLTQLRIDEVSVVIKGANPGAKVMIRKMGDDPPYLFDDIVKLTPWQRSWRARREQRQRFLNSPISKTEMETPMLDITKLLEITEHGLNAQVTPRDGESFAKAFSRKYETDESYRRQWQNHREIQLGMATLEPTSTEVGSSEFEDDSAEAVRLLNAKAAENGTSFEIEFSDPKNAKLAQATYPYRIVDWHSAATPT